METEVFSCGGGTQSSAIAALICKGILPKPDIAVMVDTGYEKSTTWEYANAVLIPELAKVGVELKIIKTADWATVDLYSKQGDLLLPVYTTQSGKLSKMPTFCSNEWKRRPVQRYLRSLGVEDCRVWIGISADEEHRCSVSSEKWYQHRYVLLEGPRYRRSDCYVIVRGIGWPEPPDSACYICPNRPHETQKRDRINSPQDFALAVTMDHKLRESDPDVYIHSSGIPLDEVDWDSQLSMFDDGGCKSGYCFT